MVIQKKTTADSWTDEMTFCCHDHKELILKARKVKSKVGNYPKLSKLNDRMSKAVRVDLTHGIRTFKKSVSKPALAKAVETGSYGHIMRAIPWKDLPDHLDPVKKPINQTLAESSGFAIKAFPNTLAKKLRFDLSNPRIRDYVNRRTGELIENIKTDTQQTIAKAVMTHFSHAQSPSQIADRIVGSIGLTERHETAVMNYQNGLEAQGVNPDRIDTLVENYQDKLLDYRANMIARTEVARANNEGQLAVWGEAKDQGLIDQSATKVWVVDGNPCPICEPMDGEEVALDDVWILDDGTICDIPTDAHPNCMCLMTINFGNGETQGEDEDGE